MSEYIPRGKGSVEQWLDWQFPMITKRIPAGRVLRTQPKVCSPRRESGALTILRKTGRRQRNRRKKKKTKVKNKAKSLPCDNRHVFETLHQDLDSPLWIPASPAGKGACTWSDGLDAWVKKARSCQSYSIILVKEKNPMDVSMKAYIEGVIAIGEEECHSKKRLKD